MAAIATIFDFLIFLIWHVLICCLAQTPRCGTQPKTTITYRSERSERSEPHQPAEPAGVVALELHITQTKNCTLDMQKIDTLDIQKIDTIDIQ